MGHTHIPTGTVRKTVFLQALFFLVLSLPLLTGCSIDHPVFREGKTERRVESPRKIGVLHLDTYMFIRTTGGVLEPNHASSIQLRRQSAETFQRLLNQKLDRVDVVYPVSPLQHRINRFAPERLYLDQLIRSLHEVHLRSNGRPHLAPYPLPEELRALRKKGFSHLLFYSSLGAVASGGRTAFTVQRTLVYLALGGITVPVLDVGTGFVVVLNLKKNNVEFFNRITDPRRFTLSDRGDLRELCDTLLEPYLDELRSARGAPGTSDTAPPEPARNESTRNES